MTTADISAPILEAKANPARRHVAGRRHGRLAVATVLGAGAMVAVLLLAAQFAAPTLVSTF